MDIKEFVKHVIDRHVLLSVNTAVIWIDSEEMTDIMKSIFLLFNEPLILEIH